MVSSISCLCSRHKFSFSLIKLKSPCASLSSRCKIHSLYEEPAAPAFKAWFAETPVYLSGTLICFSALKTDDSGSFLSEPTYLYGNGLEATTGLTSPIPRFLKASSYCSFIDFDPDSKSLSYCSEDSLTALSFVPWPGGERNWFGLGLLARAAAAFLDSDYLLLPILWLCDYDWEWLIEIDAEYELS